MLSETNEREVRRKLLEFAGRILGQDWTEQKDWGSYADPMYDLFVGLAQELAKLKEEVQLLKEPLGTPAQRSSLQQAEDQAGGTWDDPAVRGRPVSEMDPKDPGMPLAPTAPDTPDCPVRIPRNEYCGCCQFYNGLIGGKGLCRWRPMYVPRHPSDWCGRFLRKPAVLP